jgi:chaperonin GroES
MSVQERIRLVGPRILIKPDKPEEKTEGGIIIPDAFQQLTEKATVVAVGSGYRLKKGKRHPVCVEVGDRIVFGKAAGVKVFVEEEAYVILEDVGVVAKIEKGGIHGKESGSKEGA